MAAKKPEITAMTKEYLCETVNKLGFNVSVEQVEKDIAAGFETNAGGTINILDYTAWILLSSKNARAGKPK